MFTMYSIMIYNPHSMDTATGFSVAAESIEDDPQSSKQEVPLCDLKKNLQKKRDDLNEAKRKFMQGTAHALFDILTLKLRLHLQNLICLIYKKCSNSGIFLNSYE